MEFAIRSILSNPVYAEADEAVQAYFSNMGVPIYFGDAEDGQNISGSEHVKMAGRKFGILAYNRTLQRTGKTNRYRDMSDWVVAMGRHEPIISGADWVRTQKILKRNGEKCKPKERTLYE